MLADALRHYHAGNLAQARDIALAALGRSPDHLEAMQLLGAIAARSGDHGLAVDYFSAVARSLPHDFETLNNLGVVLQSAGRKEEAVEVLHRVVGLFPERREAHANLASALRAAGRLEETARAYETYLQRWPDEEEAWLRAGAVCHQLGWLEESERLFLRAQRINPSSAGAIVNLATLACSRGDHEKSLEYLEPLFRAGTATSAAHFVQGMAYLGLQRHDLALTAFHLTLLIDPAHPSARYQVEETLEWGGRWKDAIPALSARVDADPAHPGHALALGAACLRLGLPSEAGQCFASVLERHPGSVWARLNLAYALLEQGDIGGSRSLFGELLARDPANPEYRLNLAILDQARSAGETRLDMEAGGAGSPGAGWNAGGVRMLAAGENASAILHFLMAVLLDPGADWAMRNLARVLVGMGRLRLRLHFIDGNFGHMALFSDVFLRRAQLWPPSPRVLPVFVCGSDVANRELLAMIRREVDVVEHDELRTGLKGNLHPMFYQSKQMGGTADTFEYDLGHSALCLTDAQQRLGKDTLREWGLDPERDWFVCILARDEGYYSHYSYTGGAACNFRNADINDFRLAIEHITGLGGHVIRLGQHVERPYESSNPRYIDYPNRYRSEFMDLWLVRNARFVMGTPAGICHLTEVFDVPFIAVDSVPMGYAPYNRNNLCLFKTLHHIADDSPVSMSEYIALPGKQDIFWDKGLAEAGLYYRDNTPEEILEAVKEMLARLEDRFVSDPAAEAVYQRYLRLFPPDYWTEHYRTRPAENFLLAHADQLR